MDIPIVTAEKEKDKYIELINQIYDPIYKKYRDNAIDAITAFNNKKN